MAILRHSCERRRVRPQSLAVRLGRIAPHIEKNARPGTPLSLAVDEYRRGQEREDGPTMGETAAMMRAWLATPAEERSCILNGWRSRDEMPTPAEALAWLEDVPVLAALHVETGGEKVSLMPDYIADCGSLAPVRISILEGTSKVDALEALRQAIAVLDGHFDEAVRLGDHDFISIEAGELPGVAQPAFEALARAEVALDDLRKSIGAKATGEVSGVEQEASLRRVMRTLFEDQKRNRRSAGVSKLGGKGRAKAAKH